MFLVTGVFVRRHAEHHSRAVVSPAIDPTRAGSASGRQQQACAHGVRCGPLGSLDLRRDGFDVPVSAGVQRFRDAVRHEDHEITVAEHEVFFLEARVAPEINAYWIRAEFPHHLVPEIARFGIVGTSYKGYGFRGRSPVLDGFIALELARTNPSYEDIASKFLEHTVEIVEAMNNIGDGGLWDEADGFYYDQLLIEGRDKVPLRVRSLVGLLPILAVEVLDQDAIDQLPGFKKRLKWFVKFRYDLAKHISYQRVAHISLMLMWGLKRRLPLLPERRGHFRG